MTATDLDEFDLSDDEPPPERRRWWSFWLPQSRAQAVAGGLALAFFVGALGYFIGRQVGDTTPSSDSADVGFLYDMSAHHLQAVELSVIELANGSDPTVQGFALEILRSQSWEIGLMQMLLGTWGYDPFDAPEQAMAWMGMSATAATMPGMASGDELAALRAASGSEADALFLALMSDHHAGGVNMANAAVSMADDDWVVDTARRMAAVQTQEINEMEAARDRAGLPADPPGFTADMMLGDMDDMGDMN